MLNITRRNGNRFVLPKIKHSPYQSITPISWENTAIRNNTMMKSRRYEIRGFYKTKIYKTVECFHFKRQWPSSGTDETPNANRINSCDYLLHEIGLPRRRGPHLPSRRKCSLVLCRFFHLQTKPCSDRYSLSFQYSVSSKYLRWTI